MSYSVRPVETPQDASTLLRRHAPPIVRDRKDGLFITIGDVDGNLAPVAAMLEGVVDEIGNGVEQQVSIAGHENLPISGEGEVSPVLLRRSIEQLHDVVRNRGQIHRAERGSSIARLDLRNAGDRGEQAQDVGKVVKYLDEKKLRNLV